MRRAACGFLFTISLAWTQQNALRPNEVIRLQVDATDAPRRLIHVQETIPVNPGPLILLYPKWIPGEHGPTGPIADVVSLKFQAQGQTLSWKRDATDLYAFRVNVPTGASSLDVSFDFISPPDAGGFTSGSSMTTELAVISWNQFLLYPQGVAAEDLTYQARLRLPRGWRYGTALPAAKEGGAGSNPEVEFRPVPLTMLIDSPVSTGAHYKTIELGTVGGAKHYIHIAADSERAIADTPEWINRNKKLLAEAGALFGARHYREYHFLLTLSDHVASFGLEHHESSDDRLGERTLLDENSRQLNSDLLAHEYVHSWNGKYRRPSDLVTRTYNEPMKSELLWIYEGLTEYLGEVLAARSGLVSQERFRDWLADIAGRLDHQAGRAWRPLADTAISAQILFDARGDYANLRRGIDFYSEGALVWLDADVEIRQLSKGTRSLDDFCRLFFGGQGGLPKVAPYTMQDVLGMLQNVQPNDWAGFFQKRVDSIAERAPLEGIRSAGWRIVYNDRRSDYWSAEEDQNKTVDLSLSIGLTVNSEGYVNDVAIASPAQSAGIAPGARITSVGGRQFTAPVLREAVQAAVRSNDPIGIVVKNGEYFSTHKVDYHGGERYPHLERDSSKADLLDTIMRSRVGR